MRIILPSIVKLSVTEQVLSLFEVMDAPYSNTELMAKIGLTHRENFRTNYIQKALSLGLIELTIPEKPRSSRQKYRLTKKGKAFKKGK